MKEISGGILDRNGASLLSLSLRKRLIFEFMSKAGKTQEIDHIIRQCNQVGYNVAKHITDEFSDSTSMFNWVRQKNVRARTLREGFSESFSGSIYITSKFFKSAGFAGKGLETRFLNFEESPERFENSVVLLSNDDFSDKKLVVKYIKLFLNSPSSIFVIWDFDNHHWVQLSSMLAAFSDFYVPAHADNLAILSRLNNSMAGPVTAGVIQWSREFLNSNTDIITDSQRSDQPLGKHVGWRQFPHRTNTLNSLNKKFSQVKAVDASYFGREDKDRLKEWSGHKAHWIVPVLNDIPIRIFDALITGGIPIVPRSLKYHKDICDLHDHIFFYDYEDIENSQTITESANRYFDQRGMDGILMRHSLAINSHHVDNRLEKIISDLASEFGISCLLE